MAAPDSHREHCSLDVSVAISDKYPNEYSKKCLSPKTVYSYPDSSSNDSSPLFTPSSLSPRSSNQQKLLTSSEFVSSAIPSDEHVMMNVPDGINIFRREKNVKQMVKSDRECVNDDDSPYESCNSSWSGVGGFHNHKQFDNCSNCNGNNGTSENGNGDANGEVSGSEGGQAQKMSGNVESGCVDSWKTGGNGIKLAEVNSLGAEWAGTKFLPAQLELWPSQYSREIEPAINELSGTTSCCTEEREGAQVADQSDRTWLNFDKYGIDIDLFVGSSRLSPVHSSWYSSSSSNFRQAMEGTQDGVLLEESNDHLANLFSGFDMSNREGESHRSPEDSEAGADALEVLSGRGWSVSSPFNRNDIQSPIRNSNRSQSAGLTREKSGGHSETGSESYRLRDDSQPEQSGDQLQYTRRPLGAFGGKRSAGGKSSGFRFPVFWHSQSVNSPIDVKVTKSQSDMSQSDVSQALGRSISDESGDRRQRSKGRKRMVSSFKRWLSGSEDIRSNGAPLHQ